MLHNCVSHSFEATARSGKGRLLSLIGNLHAVHCVNHAAFRSFKKDVNFGLRALV